MTPWHSLRLLTSVLRGQLPQDEDWLRLLEVANRGWLVPAVFVALHRHDQLDQVPEEVRAYVAHLHERNVERNRRLRAQLLEAAAALNLQGMEPVLLKGAVHLVTASPENLGQRMISDLDISIAPFEMDGARAGLQGLGYLDLGSGREFGREQDVGVIELHDRPSRPSARYLSQDLRALSPRMADEGAVIRIPSATSRALHLIVHDMIKDGDYWSFRIDLRHLLDLTELANSAEGIDWEQLGQVLGDARGRKALVVQAKALDDLFGIEIPKELRAGWSARLRHVCRLAATSSGPVGSAARVTGNVLRGINRLQQGYAWENRSKFFGSVFRRLASPGKGARL